MNAPNTVEACGPCQRGRLLAPQMQYHRATELLPCPFSERVDGPLHSWRFDGDDPHVVCVYCDQMQDALTGRVIRKGRTS